jgi:hypothetical protein
MTSAKGTTERTVNGNGAKIWLLRVLAGAAGTALIALIALTLTTTRLVAVQGAQLDNLVKSFEAMDAQIARFDVVESNVDDLRAAQPIDRQVASDQRLKIQEQVGKLIEREIALQKIVESLLTRMDAVEREIIENRRDIHRVEVNTARTPERE